MSAFQTLSASLGRHRHRRPYAAVVLEGCFEEAGEAGRFTVAAGDVIAHGAFSSHCDRIERPCVILNIDLPDYLAGSTARLRVRDLDVLVRTALKDPREAAGALTESARLLAPEPDDPVDRLAMQFVERPHVGVAECAEQLGCSRQSVYRRFQRLYGVGPARFRTEARARRAWVRIVTSAQPLAVIAVEEGFSDQAHMNRALRSLTGRTPGHWRRVAQHSFNTGPAQMI